MHKLCIGGILAALMALTTTFATASTWKPMMTPEEVVVASRDAAVKIIDIRHRKLGYDRGHMPGAISMPLWSWRGPAGRSGQPPSEAELTEMVRAAGLDLDDRVLIVHSGLNDVSFASASWVYWVMKSSGFKTISILDGGIRAWKAAEGAITKKTPRLAPSSTRITFSDDWLASGDQVEAITSGAEKGALLDSRADEMVDTRTIKGAMSYAITRLMSGSSSKALSPLDTLEKLKLSGIEWESQSIVTFCNNGLQGAATWFLASEVAGVRNVRLYAESLQGWAARPGN